MSWHPAEEDLVLYCYGELAARRRESVGSHLAACDACRRARDEIAGAMRAFDAADVPEPDATFERTLPARVAAAVAASGGADPATWPPLRSLLPAGVWVGALFVAGVAAFLSMVFVDRSRPERAAALPGVQERVLLTALDDHFARTELLLVELLNAPADAAPSLQFERAVADDLVASGRLYRDTARQTGETQVTAVLDDLEAVLVEVARGPDPPAAPELDLLRLQIDEYGLLFKVRAVGDRIRERREDLVPFRHNRPRGSALDH